MQSDLTTEFAALWPLYISSKKSPRHERKKTFWDKKKTFLWQLKTELFSLYEVTAKASTSPFLDSQIEDYRIWEAMERAGRRGAVKAKLDHHRRRFQRRRSWRESLSPRSVVRVALEERFKFFDVYTTINGDSIMGASSQSQLQHKLYKLLINVCLKDDGTKVNPVAIKEAAYHLPYLILELHNNLTFVGNVLQWEEIGFVVQIRGQKNKVVKKHFAINLHSKRFQRSPPGGGSARHKDDFPD